MGGKSSQETTSSSVTNPWAPAQPALTSLLSQLGGKINSSGLTGAETRAIDAMAGSAAAGNPYASRIGGVADALLGGGTDRSGMVNDAYAQYRSQLDPIARGDYVDPSKNAALQSYLSGITDNVMNRVNSTYAAAGRDPSGAGSFGRSAGAGITEATAPILYTEYNRARGEQLGAIDSLFNAGGATAGALSGMDQQRLGNMQTGVGVAGAAQDASMWGPQMAMAAEAARRGIPMEQLQQLTGLVGGIASLGNSSSGTSKTTKNPSLLEQASGWTNVWRNFLPKPV